MTYTPYTQNKRHHPNAIYASEPERRNKYYAWLKHRTQARYRGEDYGLSWEDWESLWSDDLWAQRGRKSGNLCLMMHDKNEGWCLNNVSVVTRGEQLKRQRGKKKNV